MVTAGEFLLSLLLIVVAAEAFTNAVEWAGYQLGLAAGATGSLLAALGTALPETTVPVVAIATRQPHFDEVAIGAIVGAPFLLLTLGTGITGLAVALRRDAPDLVLDRHQVRRDLLTFAVAFALLLVSVVLPQAARAVVAVMLVALYADYVRRTLGGSAPAAVMPEPLHLMRRRERPHGAAIVAQLVLAVGMLVIGADLFVRALDSVAEVVHIAPLLLALVIVPLATELPETLNSVLWVRARNDGLAFGNVAGATAFQACVPGAIGVAFTSWSPGTLGLVNAAVTMVAALYTVMLLADGRCRGWRLALSALPWAAYALLVVTAGSRLQAG